MKKLFVAIFLSVLAVLPVAAQEITVASIEEQITVLRARTSPVYDNNGDLCALVEVAAPSLEGIEFDKDKTVGTVVYAKGVYSLHIPAGTRRLGFRHDEFLPGAIDFAAAGITVTGGSTYSVVLEKPAGQSAVGFLMFNVSPGNALLELDGEVLPVGQDGYATKTVIVGRSYHYTASLKGYHTVEGSASVSEAGMSEEIPIELKEAFGSVRIGSAGNETIAGASVYMDNELLPDKAPLLLERIASGPHTVRIVRDLYKSVTTTIQVYDGAETTVDPVLESNSATVNVSAPAGAEIWIDNVRKSTGSWLGTLSSGTHIIEARKGNDVISSQVFEISASAEVQNITLTAAHGSIIVSSSPVKATVLLDGKEVGVTPLLIPDIEVGAHEVTLSKEGFSKVTRTVTVDSGKNAEVDLKLEAAESTTSILPATVPTDVPAVSPVSEPAVSEPAMKSRTRGSVFIGAGIGMNYLKTYERLDPSLDIIAGYAKRFGGYVHLNGGFGGGFKYKSYDSVINIKRSTIAGGLATGLFKGRMLLLTGIGFFNRGISFMTESEVRNYYSMSTYSAAAVDLACQLRLGHMGLYFGACIPMDYQYTDFHAGVSVLF